MKSKKIVFIGIIVIVVGLVLCVLVLLLSQLSTNTTSNTTNTVSNPVSNPDVNIIDLNNSPGGAFDIVVLKADDTIELRNKLNEKFIIGLDKRSWKSLSWNPSGTLVSVLGKTTDTIYDIYIYDLSKKSWAKVTDFKNFPSGVDQYEWVDNNTILFTQGTIPTKWIHKYNYISKETLKVSNIAGNITGISPERNYIIVQATDSVPEIYNAQGVKVDTYLTQKDVATNDQLAFDEIHFFKGSTKILGLATNGFYYKYNLGDTTAVKTTLTSDFKIVCASSENSFTGYSVTGNKLSYGTFSSKDDVLNVLGEEEFKKSFSVDSNLSYCSNGNVYLKLLFADSTTQWYKQTTTQLQADAVLDGNKESDIINH